MLIKPPYSYESKAAPIIIEGSINRAVMQSRWHLLRKQPLGEGDQRERERASEGAGLKTMGERFEGKVRDEACMIHDNMMQKLGQ